MASEKSAQNGIPVEDVSKLVLQVLQSKNPKKTYSIGMTSHLSVWFSRLPINWQYFISKKILSIKKK